MGSVSWVAGGHLLTHVGLVESNSVKSSWRLSLLTVILTRICIKIIYLLTSTVYVCL